MQYGAAMELRQDNGEAPGGGVNSSISGSVRNRNTIYFRRDYGYVGTNQLGFLRFGQTDGPGSLYLTGTFENFNDGAWNGDLPSIFTGGTADRVAVRRRRPDLRDPKIVYLSPQFAGFDFGASFAPNSGDGTFAPGNCPYGVTANAGITGPIGGGLAPLGCDAASSTSSGDYARRPQLRRSRRPLPRLVRPGRRRGRRHRLLLRQGRRQLDPAEGRAVQRPRHSASAACQVTYGGLAVGGNVMAARPTSATAAVRSAAAGHARRIRLRRRRLLRVRPVHRRRVLPRLRRRPARQTSVNQASRRRQSPTSTASPPAPPTTSRRA